MSQEIVPRHTFVFTFMSFVFRVYLRIGGYEVVGYENIPKTGAVILAPNHVSLLDPPLVGVTCGRKPFIMAKEELFSGIQGWAIQRMGSFPVKRGGADRAALRRAKEILGQDKLLLIFPEGTRSRTGELGAAEAGVAMLAHMNKAPIVPVYISGTEKAFSPRGKGFRFVKARIEYGKPLFFEEEYAQKANRENLEKIGSRIMDEIGALGGKERQLQTATSIL
jgi:1-acyl-sn-glycerol-3-phosphate acyltransferase